MTRAIAALVLSAMAAAIQAPFRASTQIVPVYVTVRGADGHLVTDLQQPDFEILERGRSVPVAVFSNQPQPITVTMLVDMTGGIFSAEAYATLKKALDAFVDELRPEDRARIGTFSGNEIALGYHLTGDQTELHRVIAEEVWPTGGRRPLWNAVGAAIRSLADEQGRRIVLVVTNGPNTLEIPGFPTVGNVERAALDPNLMVYGVVLFTQNQPWLLDAPEGLQTRLTLRDLTAATGGGYFQAVSERRGQYMRGGPGPQLVTTLASVVDELRHQYVLGFTPTFHDGKVGKIEVQTSRQNVMVAARKTYRAPEGGR